MLKKLKARFFAYLYGFGSDVNLYILEKEKLNELIEKEKKLKKKLKEAREQYNLFASGLYDSEKGARMMKLVTEISGILEELKVLNNAIINQQLKFSLD